MNEENEVWGVYDVQTHNEIQLLRVDPGCWEMYIDNPIAGTGASKTLDRKHLKDLFNAIGHEINAFGD